MGVPTLHGTWPVPSSTSDSTVSGWQRDEVQRARSTERSPDQVEAVEAERGGDLGDLGGETVEVGNIVGLRTPAGKFEHDHAEPLGKRVESERHAPARRRPAGTAPPGRRRPRGNAP